MHDTTIRVSRELHDRLADRARQRGTTLSGAIEMALDESTEQLFWEAVRAEHASLPHDERERYARSDAALTDDLDDAADDTLSEHSQW